MPPREAGEFLPSHPTAAQAIAVATPRGRLEADVAAVVPKVGVTFTGRELRKLAVTVTLAQAEEEPGIDRILAEMRQTHGQSAPQGSSEER